MKDDNLLDQLTAWVEEYPSVRDHGWTHDEINVMVVSLWEFLQDNIGPTQQKLWDDLQLARERATFAERETRRVGDELARLLRDSASNS